MLIRRALLAPALAQASSDTLVAAAKGGGAVIFCPCIDRGVTLTTFEARDAAAVKQRYTRVFGV